MKDSDMSGDEDRGENINVRCTRNLKRKVGMAAKATDRSLSEYVREELNDAAVRDLAGVDFDDLSVDA